MQSDTDFHLRIVKCGGNKVISDILAGVYEQLYIKYRPEYLNEERMAEAELEHAAVLTAMEARDTNKVRKILKKAYQAWKETYPSKFKAISLQPVSRELGVCISGEKKFLIVRCYWR